MTQSSNVYRDFDSRESNGQHHEPVEQARKPGRHPDFIVSTQVEFELISDGQVLTKPTWLNGVGAAWMTQKGNISVKIGHMSFLLKPVKKHG